MVALDANLLLELLEHRGRVFQVQAAIEKWTTAGQSFGVSTLSVSHTFYLAEAHKVPLEMVEQLILHLETYSVVPEDITWALAHYKGQDFEDALQVAAALRERCTALLTLDALLAKKYGTFLRIELIR